MLKKFGRSPKAAVSPFALVALSAGEPTGEPTGNNASVAIAAML